MKPQVSLPCSQQPAVFPYYKPDESSPRPPNRFIYDQFQYYPHLRLGLQNGVFPLGLPTKSLYAPLVSSVHSTCPAHLILLDLITMFAR
jgi:hypothetical protein